MKRKIKGHIPIWAKPILWGNGQLARTIWINLYAGLLLMFIAMIWIWQLSTAVQNISTIVPLILVFIVGFYLSIASALLIIRGYGEED
jgi:hypothetical protein